MSESKSILIIGGEARMRNLASRLFGDAAREVIAATTGSDGLRAALEPKVGLVFVDASAQAKRALQLVNAIKKHKPNLPVILTQRDGADNGVERAIILCGPHLVCPEHHQTPPIPRWGGAQTARGDDIPITASLRDVEKYHIERVLKHKNWNQCAAARVLGIDRKTLANKMREFHLTSESDDES